LTNSEGLELSEKEKEERSKLLAKGFGTWKKSEYLQFAKACAEHGRNNINVCVVKAAGLNSRKLPMLYLPRPEKK
jgi:hypothetical protein